MSFWVVLPMAIRYNARVMRIAVIKPSRLEGTIKVPPSKSLLHRGLVCSALAGDLDLCALPDHGDMSADISATLDCIRRITAARGSRGAVEIDCGESGTTLRLLVPVLAALGIESHVTGEGRLPTRPLAAYKEAFNGHGIRLDFPGDGKFLPLSINGKLTPGSFTLPGNISSQYVSGLLIALPLLGGDSQIVLTSPLESEPYVDMTLDVMRHFGVTAKRAADGYSVQGSQRYSATRQYKAEPDFSQAAFWLLAAHLGHGVRVETLPQKTSQGDSAFAAMLAELANGSDHEYVIDVANTPDLVPALAAAAAASPRATRIVNAARLRLKESDRIESTIAMLRAFGVEAEALPDGIVVHPRALPFEACTVDGANDHRIVMAAAVMATRADGPVTIDGCGAINKSYPTFFDHFRQAGGSAHEFDVG